jgi:hypothetical protein
MNEPILVIGKPLRALALMSRSLVDKGISTRKELIMRPVNHREKDLENHDRGLDYDLPRLLHRRGMLKLVAGAGLAGAGLITLGACTDATTAADTSAPEDGNPPSGGPRGWGCAPAHTDQRHSKR